MGRVGLHGKIPQGGHYADATQYLEANWDSVENTLNGQIDSTNIATSGVATANIADGAVTAAKLAASSVTSAAVDSTVSKIASGSYTGDGATANRIVTLPFTPRWILIVRTDATFIEFVSLQDSGVATFWYRDVTGARTASTANFQGIVTNGVKLGTSATGTSNANGVVYRYTAIG